MKIDDLFGLACYADIIGKENIQASRKLLADGGEMWVFQSLEELEIDQEIEPEGKKWCKERFAAGETWAGWFRSPTKSQRRCIPGFETLVTPSGYIDSHGNWRSNNPCGINYKNSH